MLKTDAIDETSLAAMQQPGLALANSYADLPAHFYSPTDPTPVARPRLIKFNAPLAAELGLDVVGLTPEMLAGIFSGNVALPGSRRIAMAYAGHQFGQFVPQLGDGRAILLGEAQGGDGRRRDIQLKGSGRTPYSRGGDGRAALGPVLREYLVSEAMHALGLPTTRALAAVATGEPVFREGRLPGAILTRVAASHVRVGTFQFFAARGDTESVKRLADYVIDRHYPEVAAAPNRYMELLRAVSRRQARLVADWMSVGFIHGVMNTDNMAVSGETIDFGPCAFMDDYDPATVFSSIDRMGRYAYGNQPPAAQWNLARLAETLLPLIDTANDAAIALASEAIDEFSGEFAEQWLSAMRRKLGLFSAENTDEQLIRGLLEIMQREHADFTLTFRRLCALAERGAATEAARETQADAATVGDIDAEWVREWQSRVAREAQPAAERAAFMRRVNPAFIPRNHRIEAVISAAIEEDFSPFEELGRVLAHPYEEQPALAQYAEPPRPEERVLQTFCGT